MKLVNSIADFQLPESVRYGTEKSIRNISVNKTAFVYWPNGTPCFGINAYLLSNLHIWTGDTVVTFAHELAHLVKYCAAYHRRFDDLTDEDIEKIIAHLVSETRENKHGIRRRNNNTVRRIMQRIFLFLEWYQDSLCSRITPIIGVSSTGASIICEKKTDKKNRNHYWHHRYFPSANSVDPKLPIGLPVIEKIEATIYCLGNYEEFGESAKKQCGNDEVFFKEKIDYLYSRRVFMIWLMKRTGLRPGEMATISVNENINVQKQLYIIIPTLKRRRKFPPPRLFSISEKDARVFSRYLSARKRWIDACDKWNCEVPHINDSLFLGAGPGNYGVGVGKIALAKDFQMLSKLAGFQNQQTCFSMFRHRFITLEVLAHLREWEQTKGAIVIDQDYRSLLERVRLKTGHASVESLWHYIDIARNFDGAWDTVDQAIEKRWSDEQMRAELVEIVRNAKVQIEAGSLKSEDIREIFANLETSLHPH